MRIPLEILLILAAPPAHAGDLGKYLATVGAHVALQAGTDGASSVSALHRPGTMEANPRGVWGAVALDSVAFGSADYLTGKIRNKPARLVTQNLVRAGALYFAFWKMQSNNKVGR